MTIDELNTKLKSLTDQYCRKLTKQIMNTIEHSAYMNIAGKILKVRTGQLKRYYAARKPEYSLDQKSVVFGMLEDETEGKIAGKQEVGGEIRPRNGRLLRIPLPPALTGAGVDRYPGILKGRKDLGLFFHKSASGSMSLCKAVGKKPPHVEAWYALVSRVTLIAKGWLKNAIDELNIEAQAGQVEREMEP